MNRKFIIVWFSLLLLNQPGIADTLTTSQIYEILLPSEILNLEEIREELKDSIGSYLWKHVEVESISGEKIKKLWYRFPILNNKDVADTLYFEIIWEFNTYCYVYHEDYGLLSGDTVGFWTNPFNRIFPEHPFVGKISLEPGLSMVYFGSGITNDSVNYFNIRFHDKTSIYTFIYKEKQSAGIQMLINTLSIGFLTFIFLFFLFYAILVRERLYVYYAVYLFLALMFCLTMWNDLPSQAQAVSNSFFRFRYYLNETAVAWMFAAYIFFTDRLLLISPQIKWFGKLLKIEALILMLYGLWHLIFKAYGWYPEVIEHSYFYFRILFMPNYVLLLIFILFKIRSELKLFFLLASFSLLTGVISSIMVDFASGVLEVSDAVIYPGALLQIGIIFETIFFSLALGYNNKLIYDERDQHRKQYIEQLQENNRLIKNEKNNLENKVSEARREITEKQAQIEARKIALLKSEFENRIQELTIQSLEAQMNPHFLFNGLSAVRDLVMKNHNREAMEYMNTFALLLRNSLNNNRKQSISLQEEIEGTKHYLQIEKLRFGKSLEFTVNVDPAIDPGSIEVPPKLLQPIAENCIKHGLRHSSNKIKCINISVFSKLNGVCIFIEDNGIGLEASRKFNEANKTEVTHLGLKLLADRLLVFNEQLDSHITLEIEEIKGLHGEVLGTRVSVSIKYPS